MKHHSDYHRWFVPGCPECNRIRDAADERDEQQKRAAELATRNTVPAHDWPKPIPGRRGKEVQCKRCGRYSNEGDGPCVPAKRGESEARS